MCYTADVRMMYGFRAQKVQAAVSFLASPCRNYPRRKLYVKYCRSHSGAGERRRQTTSPYFFCRIDLLDMHQLTSLPSSIGSTYVWSPLGRLESRPTTLFPLPISSHLLLVDNRCAVGNTSNTPNTPAYSNCLEIPVVLWR